MCSSRKKKKEKLTNNKQTHPLEEVKLSHIDDKLEETLEKEEFKVSNIDDF